MLISIVGIERYLSGCGSERSERGAKLGAEELWLFPRCEVAAFLDFAKIDQVRIGAPCPRLRGSVDLLGKHRDRYGKRYLGGLLRACEKHALAAGFPVDPRR